MTEASFYNLRVVIRKILISLLLLISAAFLFDLIIGYSPKGQIVEKCFVRLYYISFFLNGCFSNFKNGTLRIIEGILVAFFCITIFVLCEGGIIIASYYEDEKYAIRNGINGVEFIEKTDLFEKRLGHLEFQGNEYDFDIHKGLGKITYDNKSTIKTSFNEAKLVP